MSKFPEYYTICDNYGETLKQYFLHKYNAIPSKYTSKGIYKGDAIDWFLANGYSIIHTSTTEEDSRQYEFGGRRINSSCISLINTTEEVMVRFDSNHDKERTQLYFITILYDCEKKEMDKIINWEDLDKYCDNSKSNIFLVVSEDGQLCVRGYDLTIDDINLGMSYGEKFEDIHKVIIDKLNTENGKGIILLHGDPGTGKTTYIKYLTKLITNKEVLFIPPSMAEVLSEPQIIPFLMNHKNSILVIEDAEKVISDRRITGSSAGVSNILNLTDGILGDCLGIQIIATFNMERSKIDDALLRKGRLIAEHKFRVLTIDETDKLLNHLGKKNTGEEMTLADIYNVDEEVIKSDDNQGKIGFTR